MGLHESPEEILACPYNCNVALAGCFNRAIAGLCCGAIYLHIILNNEYHIKWDPSYNPLLLTISLVTAAVVGENYLRYDRRYTELGDENLIRSQVIGDRPAHVTQFRERHDRNINVEVKYNDYFYKNIS